ncbi:unnamed protein product [Rhizoctonia solani]|uniref:F-box domain-containing protein n=1 Tax=Rhizoctonia solani TaxID=456999 RepID=A0A8H2WEI6_9AGAM|nr:unnamed protein product [Rhizoctonia solani]
MNEDDTAVDVHAASESLSIHTFPNELLVVIFAWACHQRLCKDSDRDCTDGCAKAPGAIMLVCSRWRQIVMETPIFWSHIDIFPHRLSGSTHLANVKKHMSMVKQSPVDIHIVDDLDLFDSSGLEAFYNIINQSSPRMRSLTFQQAHYSLDRSREVLYQCLENNIPGMLEELTLILDDECDQRRLFIEAVDCITSHSHPPIILKNMTVGRLEAALLSISTLRLCGAFPYWVSSAYSGLVELCLHSKRDGSQSLEISHSSIMRILSSSPKLQILDLDIDLTAVSESFIEPIYLEDLQIIRTGSMSRPHFGHLLEPLFPGTGPLTICCRGYPSDLIARDTGIKAFFARANVQRIWLRPYSPYKVFLSLGLFELAPRTRELALELRPHIDSAHESSEPDDNDHRRRIDTLHLLSGCEIEISHLEQIAQCYRVQKLRIHPGCRIVAKGHGLITVSTVEERMSKICQVIEWSHECGPLNWGIPSFPTKV